MVPDVLGLKISLDHTLVVHDQITEFLQITIAVEAYVDRKTLFHVVGKNGATT